MARNKHLKNRAIPYNGFYAKYREQPKNIMSDNLYAYLAHYEYLMRYYEAESTAELQMGLCNGYKEWLFSQYGDLEFDVLDAVNELHTLFLKDGLDPAFPFNDGIEDFLKEPPYKNIKRVNWVKEKIKKYGEIAEQIRKSDPDYY